MLASPDPIGYLLTVHGNETLSRLVSAGIFLSVFNAIVALVIQIGRVIYSSGRDELWMPTLNRAFTAFTLDGTRPGWRRCSWPCLPPH